MIEIQETYVEQRERNANVEYEYIMNKIPRGKCLIINNKNFESSGLPTRHGTEHDARNLEETFKWLHFEVDKVEDCTAGDLTRQILRYSEDSEIPHDHYDCFVCCVLSHGSAEGIYCKDGECISIDFIRNRFLGNECYSLHGKPKLFFIQACRGPEQDQGQRIQPDDSLDPAQTETSPETPQKLPPRVLPVDSDFVFVYGTTPGKILIIDTQPMYVFR